MADDFYKEKHEDQKEIIVEKEQKPVKLETTTQDNKQDKPQNNNQKISNLKVNNDITKKQETKEIKTTTVKTTTTKTTITTTTTSTNNKEDPKKKVNPLDGLWGKK